MIKWSDIDTVLLDMDGTLLDLSFDNFFWLEYLPARYASQQSLPLAQARARLAELSSTLQGSLNWYCLDHWSATLGLDVEALKQEVREHIRFRPGAADFLSHLRKLAKPSILITNAHPRSLALKLAASGLHRHLDRLVSSHEFALAKENPGFWHKFREREQLDLSRCLFLDDNPAVLACARREGVGHLLQVLQPDTRMQPRPASEFPGLLDFAELMDPANEKD
ncbi:MAG: GMP/IMP nucleotidase [Pseudomonadales bacterium]|nr:GMP/IMP nucleotidase [Pseudomonadales bacterium]